MLIKNISMGESECFECKCLLYDRCAQREREVVLINMKAF